MLLILVMSACLIGVANAVRELVKERPICTRERAAGLSPAAYLASKLAVLGVISAVQSVVLVAIGLAGRPMPPRGVLTSLPLAEIMLGVAVLAVASMTAGLLISAAVSSSDKTLPLLVVTVLVWNHSVHAWAVSMARQLVLAAVFAVITWTLLRRPARR